MTKEQILFSNAIMLYMADNIKSANHQPNTLWEMVCDTFNIDYEDEDFGNMFDEIWENNYIKTDILSLGSENILKLIKTKMKREVVITYNDVREYIKNNTKYSVDSIIDVVEPFSMYYIQHPVGFAETDNYNDIVKLTKEIEESFFGFELEPDGRVRRGLINTDIKREQQRWKERNAGFFGRHIGRLAYLLNEEAKK
jgi:hypothetical protein